MKKTVVFLLVVLILASVVTKVYSNTIECPTPKSLMLHSAYGSERMEQLAQELINGGYITMTYSQLYDLWDKGQCPPKNAVLVSLDDLSGVWLRHTFVEMVDVFLKYNLKLTLGVISNNKDSKQDPLLWDYFKDLDEKGIEIASHSTNHYNLPELNKAGVEIELNQSYDIICEHLGKCPETFVLPFGNGRDDKRVLEVAKGKYRSLVSIAGPDTYSGDLFILKRISPYNDNQNVTIQLLERSFIWFETEKVVITETGNTNTARRKLEIFKIIPM